MKPLEVINRFSCCGGLVLGFQRAGFDVTRDLELILMSEAVATIDNNHNARFDRPCMIVIILLHSGNDLGLTNLRMLWLYNFLWICIVTFILGNLEVYP